MTLEVEPLKEARTASHSQCKSLLVRGVGSILGAAAIAIASAVVVVSKTIRFLVF